MSASAGRVLLLMKGVYAAGTTYNPMDVVLFSGSSYVCKATTTGNQPTNTTYWQVLAQGTANVVAGCYYGECTSAGNVQNKTVTIPVDEHFVLQKGDVIGVKFTYTNTFVASAQNHVTFNVNGEGAYPVYFGDSENPTGDNIVAFGEAGYINYYQYDGTHWIYFGRSGVQNAAETPYNNANSDLSATETQGAIDELANKFFMLMNNFIARNTVFNLDGSITETDAAGNIHNTVFTSATVITETLKDSNNTLLATKTTTFNNDGSITEAITLPT